jgi:hypothetical protein
MGVVHRSVYLLLGLWLLLSGCNQVLGSNPLEKVPAPSPTAPPTPGTVTQSPQEENSLEAESLAPSPELPPSSLRLAVLPPPKAIPRVSKTPQYSARRPSLSPKPTYPKTQPSVIDNRPKPPPPSLSLETTYPKSQPSASAVEKAEAASLALERSIQSGQLLAHFHGTGHSHEMIHFVFVNQSDRPVKVRLVPGMILNPGESQQVQPLLVTEELDTVLQPGESRAGNLQSYCLDSRVPAPLPGQQVDYRFSTRTRDGGPEAVRAHRVAEELVKSSPYRHAITQIAIWRSLNQPLEEKHFYSVLGPSANDPQVRQEVLREVERVLKSL